MSLFHAAVLALVQGLTEFLPISSSAHLILVPRLLGWPDQGLAFDVVVHLGTLTAVCLYFRSDLARMASGSWQWLIRRGLLNPDARLVLLVGLATIPVGLCGLMAKDWVATAGRNPIIIAWASIGFGLLLWWADRKAPCQSDRQVGVKDALWVGLAQALALIPGTSRSGITMTAGMMLGFTRAAAARFSFLLSIPLILLSGGLAVIDLTRHPAAGPGLAPLLVGFVVSAVSAYLCIRLLLAFLEQRGMGPFVLYRVALGVVLLLTF